MCLLDKARDVVDITIVCEHRTVVGNVVPAVAQRALLKRQEPDAVDAEPLEILELADQAGEVADSVVVAVVKGTYRQLVEHGSFEPERILRELDAHGRLRTCRICAGCWEGSRRT